MSVVQKIIEAFCFLCIAILPISSNFLDSIYFGSIENDISSPCQQNQNIRCTCGSARRVQCILSLTWLSVSGNPNPTVSPWFFKAVKCWWHQPGVPWSMTYVTSEVVNGSIPSLDWEGNSQAFGWYKFPWDFELGLTNQGRLICSRWDLAPCVSVNGGRHWTFQAMPKDMWLKLPGTYSFLLHKIR